jgi:hypothetical protein
VIKAANTASASKRFALALLAGFCLKGEKYTHSSQDRHNSIEIPDESPLNTGEEHTMARVRTPKFGPLFRSPSFVACAVLITVCTLWFAVPPLHDSWTEHSLTRQLRTGEICERKQALLQLHDRGASPFADLTDMLDDPDAGVRVLASDALIWLSPKPPETIRPLIKALGDKAEEVRWNAAYALGEIGTQSGPWLTGDEQMAVQALCRAATDQSDGVRTAAMCALGQFKTKSSANMPTLLAGLKDENCSVQLAAAWALLDIDSRHDSQAIPVIVRGLSAQDENARETAMFLVQQFGIRIQGAIPLFKMPNEDDPKLQGRTASIMGTPRQPIL